MGKLFGTDGIRGIVGENLTVELAFHTGQAIASVLKEEKGRAPLITIGKDTRISSDMLESALICGICSVGGDVMPFGVLPTPAVAYLTVLKGADAGATTPSSTTASRSLTKRATSCPTRRRRRSRKRSSPARPFPSPRAARSACCTTVSSSRSSSTSTT